MDPHKQLRAPIRKFGPLHSVIGSRAMVHDEATSARNIVAKHPFSDKSKFEGCMVESYQVALSV